MNKKEKLLIFPFSDEVLPLLRSRKFNSAYSNIILCALKGSGLSGKDASLIDGGEPINILIREDLNNCIIESDSMLYVKSNFHDSNVDNIIKEVKDINIVKRKGNIDQDLINELNNTISINSNYKITYNDLLEAEGLIEINTPLIYIIGTGKNTHKFALQLSVVEGLEKQNYKVSWISSNELCELVGGHLFPHTIFDYNTSDVNKVLLFNRFLKNLEKKESSDVIVIGIPGGIMPCTNKIVGDFGLLAYKVFQAACPDYVLLSIFYEEYEEEFYKKITNQVKYRLGANLDMINICNRKIDWSEVKIINKNFIPYFTIDNYLVNNYMERMKNRTNIDLINIMRKNESSYMVDKIIDKLADVEQEVIF